MLSKKAIIDKVQKRTNSSYIFVKYSFLPKSGLFQYNNKSVDVINDEEAKAFFLSKLCENKLGVTIGKLVKIINGRKVSKSENFAGHSNIVDLLKCPDGYTIKPFESVVVLTNEWFQIDSNTAGILISRVSNYTKGLAVSCSYIDSTWKGLVELMLTNYSDSPQKIFLGDEVARVFFFSLVGEGTPVVQSEVADNSHHYGLTWETILRDNVDPFQKNKPLSTSKPFFYTIKKYFVENYKIAGGIIGIIAVASILLNFYSKLQDIGNSERKIDQHSEKISELEKQSFETGKATISINAGEFSATTTVELERYFTDGKIVFPNYEELNNSDIKITAHLSNSGRKTSLIIRLTRLESDLAAKTHKLPYIVFN